MQGTGRIGPRPKGSLEEWNHKSNEPAFSEEHRLLSLIQNEITVTKIYSLCHFQFSLWLFSVELGTKIPIFHMLYKS